MTKPERNANESTDSRLAPLPTLIFSSRWLHLLKTFIEAGMVGAYPLCSTVEAGVRCATATLEGIILQTVIHAVFILSAIGIAWTDRIMNGTSPGER